MACKAAFYTFQLYITSEVNTMRRCQECDTDLGQNVVFHKFARQIALIQCSGRSKHALSITETTIFIHEEKYWDYPESCKHINNLADLCFKPASWWTQGKRIAQSFLFTAKIITKYSSERFVSICGEKMSKGFSKFCKLISNLILGQIVVSILINVHKLAA